MASQGVFVNQSAFYQTQNTSFSQQAGNVKQFLASPPNLNGRQKNVKKRTSKHHVEIVTEEGVANLIMRQKTDS